MGETHTAVIDSRRDCEQSQRIKQRLSRVLLPPRMSNRGIWTSSRVCFGPGIFHVRSPGNPRENVSCSQLCTTPIVFHFPHWSKWKRNPHKHPIVSDEICTGNCINQIVLPVSWRDVETGGRSRSFPASEVYPELSLRCWGDKTLGFFHDTHATLWVWFIQYALAASGGFCGSYSAAGAEAQTLPGLHSKHNMHGEETNIKNLFSHVKDDIVLQLLFLLHFVTWACQLGAMQGVYSKHTHRKQV